MEYGTRTYVHCWELFYDWVLVEVYGSLPYIEFLVRLPRVECML